MLNIYSGAFFAKITNSVELLTFLQEKVRPRCLTRLKIGFWLRVLHFFFLSGFSFTDTDDSQDSRGREGTILSSLLFPNCKLSRNNTQPKKYVWHRFWKGERSAFKKVNKASVYAEAAVRRACLKRCYEKFRRIHKKTSVTESLFGVFLWILRNLQEHLFCWTAPDDCFWL